MFLPSILHSHHALLSRDEWSHIFQTPIPKILKHQLRVLFTLRKVSSNSC